MNLCDIRKDLNKVAEDALPRISRFGRPAILLDVIFLRLKEPSWRLFLSWPDMTSARTSTNRCKYRLGFKLVLWQIIFDVGILECNIHLDGYYIHT